MPKDPESLFKAGVTALVAKQYPKAIDCFQQILTDDPLHAPTHYNLGIIYFRLGQIKRSIDHHLQAIRSQPNYDRAHYSLATIYFSQNQAEAAEFYFKTALAINPDLTDAYANLGLIAEQKQNLTKARAYYKLGLIIEPHHPTLLANSLALARRYHDYPQIDQLKKTYQSVLTKQLKTKGPPGPTPFISLLINSNPQTNLHIAKWWSQHLQAQIPKTRYSHSIRKSKSIRLGYISYDFRSHVIGHLIKDLFPLHSSKFDVFLYSLHPPSDNHLFQQFSKLPNFTNVHDLSSPEIAHRIHQDSIDMLIDLTCFTKGGHPEICALRPAPIQINYLGLPGTSGADFYDYIIGDPILIPPNHNSLYTEKVLRLPHYLVTSYPKINPSSVIRHPSSPFVFACLTHPVKYSARDVLMWFTILKQVPDSQLMLQDENPTTTANLKSYAKKQHVDPDRFVFLPHLSYPNFLHKIAEIDLALDSTYYNGGSTTADLLYAGVPVITLAGHLYVERMGAAILTAAGLPELITHTRKAYINLAVSLANNPKELKLLKQRNFQNSKLFNTKLWVQNLELGLEAIWARYLQDLPPDHITITI